MAWQALVSKLLPLTAVSPSLLRCPLIASVGHPTILRRCLTNGAAVWSPPQLREREPTEEELLQSCQKWVVVMKPPPDPTFTRDEIIDFYYLPTIRKALGKDRGGIYAVSTRNYFAFACRVFKEDADAINAVPNVLTVLPDTYLDAETMEYGGF